MDKKQDFQRITDLFGDLIAKYGFETAARMIEKTVRMSWSIRDFQRSFSDSPTVVSDLAAKLEKLDVKKEEETYYE